MTGEGRLPTVKKQNSQYRPFSRDGVKRTGRRVRGRTSQAVETRSWVWMGEMGMLDAKREHLKIPDSGG